MRFTLVASILAIASYVSAAPASLSKRAATAQVITTCSVPGTIALTFDDGPFEYTWDLADYLKKEGVVATFFFNGNNYVNVDTQTVKTSAGTKTYKQVIKHVYDRGHQIGSHTYSHLELAGQSTSKIQSEMSKLEAIFRSVIGKNPLYMRPPAGSYDNNVLKTLGASGYKVIMWDIDSNDWRYQNDKSLAMEQKHYKDVIEKDSSKNPQGHIALHHDVYQKTAEQLTPWVVKYIKDKKKYKFVSVAECIGNTKGSAYRTKQ